MCEKFFLKRAKFFLFTCGFQKQFFLQLLMFMRFDHDIVLVFGLF